MSEAICSIDDCESKVLSRGWCIKHYARWRTHGNPLGKPPTPPKMCSVEGCERPHLARGWCVKHYTCWSKHGDPVYIAPAKPTVCSVEGCENARVARGWCVNHWSRWRRHGSTDSVLTERGAEPPPCRIDGCNEQGGVGGHGWCDKHYRRYQRHGDPLTTSRIVGDDLARFLSYVDKNGPVPDYAPHLGPCWIWTGLLNDDGYSVMASDLPTKSGHRWSYRHHVGDLLSDLELDHLCRVRCCVNPTHLEQVTPLVNVMRGMSPQAMNARKTHCPQGHEYTPENIYSQRNGGRCCRTCQLIQSRKRTSA